MNQSTRIALAAWLMLFLFQLPDLHAQCTGGANMGAITPTSTFQTIPCVQAGQYYTFNATIGSTYTFSFCQGGGSAPFSFDTYLTLLNNAGVPVAGVFNDNFCFPIFSEITWTATATATYRILVSLPAPGCGTNATCGVLAYRAATPFGPGTTCANPQVVGSLPYTNNGLTTCGAGDDYSSAMACASPYMDGDDYVFSYTSPGNECINLAVTGTTNWVGLFVLNGCPNAGGTACIAEAESGAGNPSLSWVNLPTAGTYYFVVSTLPPPQCTPFNMSVSRCPTGRTCADPRVISALPYMQNGMTTCGFGDDYDDADACLSSFMNGDDFVFSYTAANAQCIDVFLSNTAGWTGVFVLDGCPDNPATNCLGNNTSIMGNPPLVGVTLPAAGTYYIVVSTDPSPQCTPFDIYVDSCAPPTPCGLNPPATDACLNAPDVSGYPSFCGTTDTIQYTADIPGNLSSQFCATIENNSWFSFIADTTTINFNFFVANCYFGDGIQARVFSTSDCSTFTAVSNCFNPMTQSNGSITASGLTVGQRYYLMVDGYARDDCEYTITWDGGPLPIEYTGISAMRDGDYVHLWWQTSMEASNDGFFVERGSPRADGEPGGMYWQTVGFVAGVGNHSALQDYGFVDSMPSQSHFYRLKQVDFDGSIHFSDIVEARQLDQQRSELLGLFPNPAQNDLRVEFSSPEPASALLRLHDLSGKMALEKAWGDAQSGWNARTLDLSMLPDGLYVLELMLDSERHVARLVLQR